MRVAVKRLLAMTAEAERVVLQQELTAFMHAARHCDGICESSKTINHADCLCCDAASVLVQRRRGGGPAANPPKHAA